MGFNWRGFFGSLLTGETGASAADAPVSATSHNVKPANHVMADVTSVDQPNLDWDDVHGDEIGSLYSVDVTKIRLFSESDRFI